MVDASWERIASWYDQLAAVPLDDGVMERWLATWSRLDELVTEAASLAMIAYTCDTSAPAK